MKLYNKGWSLNTLIILCSILLFFLILASFYITKLYRSMGSEIKTNINGAITTDLVEEKIENSALLYLEKYYDEELGSGTIAVTTDNLLSYKLLDADDLNTKDNGKCTGYALLRRENNEIKSEPYILCTNYKTVGFQEWRIN